jgi:hypothetical protein
VSYVEKGEPCWVDTLQGEKASCIKYSAIVKGERERERARKREKEREREGRKRGR